MGAVRRLFLAKLSAMRQVSNCSYHARCTCVISLCKVGKRQSRVPILESSIGSPCWRLLYLPTSLLGWRLSGRLWGSVGEAREWGLDALFEEQFDATPTTVQRWVDD